MNIALDFIKFKMRYKGNQHKYTIPDSTEKTQVEMHETLKDSG